jgi:hypothetical protein
MAGEARMAGGGRSVELGDRHARIALPSAMTSSTRATASSPPHIQTTIVAASGGADQGPN